MNPRVAVARLRVAYARFDGAGVSRSVLVLVILGAVLAGFVEAMTLAIVAQVAAGTATGAESASDLGPFSLNLSVSTLAWIGVGLALVRLALVFVNAYLPSRASADVQAHLRVRLLEDFIRAPWSVQARDRNGELQDLLTSQVMVASRVVLALCESLGAMATLTVMLTVAFVLSPGVALITAVLVALLLVAFKPLLGSGRNAARQLSAAQVDFASAVADTTHILEEIQVFGVSESVCADVGGSIEQTTLAQFRLLIVQRLASGLVTSTILVLLMVGLVGLQGFGSVDVATMGATMLILLRAATYGQNLQNTLTSIAITIPYLERVDGARLRYRAETVQHGRSSMPDAAAIELREVSYRYEGATEDALSDVSLTVDFGQQVGVIGPSGSGKSTFVQLVLRLREPTSGDLRFGGVEARDISPESWRHRVAYVPQEPRLVFGTVADNIRFHRVGISDAQVEEAARRAHVHDEIMAMPNGYDYEVGRRVEGVSGGQRQRICIARALAARPGILVLDEPTSALDAQSERLIQNTLEELSGSVTVILITHRLSSLSSCDRVAILAHGHLEDFDTPKHLSAENPFLKGALREMGLSA